MNRHIFEGQWKELSGKMKATWARLTDDDIEEIGGRAEALAGKLQERYGLAADEAEEQVRAFSKDVSN